MGPPKTTYRPKNQFVHPGRDARFYCEAYVGKYILEFFFFFLTTNRKRKINQHHGSIEKQSILNNR